MRDDREEAKLTDAGLLRGDFKDGFIAALDEVDERFGDYPIVHCGDRSFVLKVDREELEDVLADELPPHLKNDRRDVRRALDAILW